MQSLYSSTSKCNQVQCRAHHYIPQSHHGQLVDLNTRVVVSLSFKFQKLYSHASIYTKCSSFLVSHVRRTSKEEKPYMNLLLYLANHKKLQISYIN